MYSPLLQRREAGKGLNVMGEAGRRGLSRVDGRKVYFIDETTLEAMDILEGVHRGRYRRPNVDGFFQQSLQR